MGWTVIRFWGKDIIQNPEECVQTIEDAILEQKIQQIEKKFKFSQRVFKSRIGNISAIAKASEKQKFMHETRGSKKAIAKLGKEFLSVYEAEGEK